MGRPKKNKEVEVEVNKEDLAFELGESKVEVKTETIHDKYRKHINTANSGYLTGLDYSSAMEMLRWMESKTNRTIPINFSCGVCMIDMVKMFANMEGR